MPYDCFISYASADIRLAEDLHRRLTAEGFTVWFDKVRLQPGFDWHREIEQGCENSRILLPILTPRWRNSDWTKYETYGAEAEAHLREAFSRTSGAPDGFMARTLFLKAALAALRGEDSGIFLGQFKTLIEKNIKPVPTRNTSVREYLQSKLAPDSFALFGAVFAAVNEPDGLAKLNSRPDWQAIGPVPFDTPWP